jgi:pimeloyl-ACP methyl ester carboxylesterase
VVALAEAGYHAIAIDQPGFGDSDKPLFAPYDAPYMARAATAFIDARGIDSAHFVGNSLGGRVALELGLAHPERTRKLGLLACSLAWKRRPAWARYLPLLRPELGLIQPAPRVLVEGIVRRSIPGGSSGWAAAGIDEFIRSYCTPRGRAAFYAAARHILLEKSEEFWDRLATLQREALFVWGRHDELVPSSFQRHVREVLPAAQHVELDCGHVPQIERPDETEAALKRFLSA